MKNINKLIFLIFALSQLGCISAGETVLKCYSRLYQDETNTKSMLIEFWKLHPENRVDEITINKIQINLYLIITIAYFVDPLILIHIIHCSMDLLHHKHLIPLNHTFLPHTHPLLILLSFVMNLLILSQHFLLEVKLRILQIFQMLSIHQLKFFPLS